MSNKDTALAQLLHEKLSEAGWPKLELSSDKKELSCPEGPILEAGKQYSLHFWLYSPETEAYVRREQYRTVTFPSDFDMQGKLFFRRSGNYYLSFERSVMHILNPHSNEVQTVKLVTSKDIKRYYKKTRVLMLSTNIFNAVINESRRINDRRKSYGNSTANYLLNIAAESYSNFSKKSTTYLQPGEFTFLVERLNLRTKKSKKDFAKYLDTNDMSSLETLLDKLLKHQALSDGFLRRLNDYFIKEHLKDVIAIGKKLLTIGKDDLSSTTAQEVLARLDAGKVGQLETLWQRYFERYLLYLIFSYKQVFPKVKLEGVEWGKIYPDFIGVNHYNGLDVIEIKTHLTKVLQWDESHKNFYFSAEMSKAITQTTNYLDSIIRQRFKDASDKHKITTFVGDENLYHPRGIIIISSTRKLTNKTGQAKELERDFTKLRNGLHNIQILTFDEVLDIPDEYITNIADNVANQPE